ncbi:zinc-finger homeodomain protein 2-like isoform X2 [Carex rostrata]
MDLSGHQGEIPIPMTTTYIPSAHTSHTHGHSLLHHTTSNNNNITPTPANANNNGPANLATEDHHSPRRDAMPAATPLSIPKKNTVTVKYKECLKNHAASIGGNATDGCGEFMPSGPDGTIEALKCSACGCHRNFHRKEVEGDPYASCHCKGPPYIYSPAGRSSISVRPALPALTHHPHHQMVMPLSAMQTSESDEMEGMGGTPGMMGSNPAMGHHNGPMPMSGMGSVHSSGKKRFRTKFTSEQKDKMLNFAEKVGWRLQRLEDGVVQQFCQEIGVKRRVLKVWMHNNKHSLAKKISPDEEQQQPPPQLQLE